MGTYKPPQFSETRFLHELEGYLTHGFLSYDKLLFVGDFNMKMAIRSPVAKDLSDSFLSRSLPTRVSKNSSTIIDHIWSGNDFLHEAGAVHCGIFNHILIFILLAVQSIDKRIRKKFWGHSQCCISNIISEMKDIYSNYAVASEKIKKMWKNSRNICLSHILKPVLLDLNVLLKQSMPIHGYQMKSGNWWSARIFLYKKKLYSVFFK